ncbi:hypothetical protein E4U57_006632 [Claviceps arundinis]|uniref:Uncharacterized protein n=1 Tax=Claviceps arundinis TaxID=1623583 RepID=A0ABQ7PMF4_9HYPO|nr:hypothetical protein E4U57_006632 [Claviceps arundinis]
MSTPKSTALVHPPSCWFEVVNEIQATSTTTAASSPPSHDTIKPALAHLEFSTGVLSESPVRRSHLGHLDLPDILVAQPGKFPLPILNNNNNNNKVSWAEAVT